jgi:hypothetical protein
MIRQLSIFAVLVGFSLIASNAHAQGAVNHLRFYSDPAGTSCDLAYDEPGIVTVHVIHTGPAPSAAVQFSAIVPECWTGATWLNDEVDPPFLMLGNTQDPFSGLSIATNGCKQLPLYVGRINVFVADASAHCCPYEPGPIEVAEQEGTLQYVDCTLPDFEDWVIRPMAPVGLVVNPDDACKCTNPVPTHETTWGKIKSLYR